MFFKASMLKGREEGQKEGRERRREGKKEMIRIQNKSLTHLWHNTNDSSGHVPISVFKTDIVCLF